MAPESDFIAMFESLNKADSSLPPWLYAHRQPAQEAFLAKGFPTLKDEDWKYTNLKTLTNTTFAVASTVGEADTVVSDPQILIEDLEKACREKGELVQAALSLASQVSQNAFTHLNDAFLGEGSFIHVRKGVKVGHVLQLTHFIRQGERPTANFPRVVIFLEEGAELCLVETIILPSEGTEMSLTSPLTDVIVKDGGKLMYIKKTSQGSITSTTKAMSYVIGHTRCHLGKEARFLGFLDRCGPRLSREGLSVMLAGEGADARLWGVFHTRGSEHIDYTINVEHAASFTVSRQLFKGVAEDDSRGVFCGRIRVGHGLHKVDARQLTKNLLLGANAEIDAKPHLEINSDDVKCTHGSAIGKLRDDEVFYLQTRGIGKQEAEAILSQAFTREVILDIKDKEFQKQVMTFARGNNDGAQSLGDGPLSTAHS